MSLASAAVLFSACAQLSTVKNAKPVPPTLGIVSAANLPSEKDQRADPEAALARYLSIAAKAWSDLERDPSNASTLLLYNYSVGRVISLVQETGKLPSAGAVLIGTGPNSYRLTYSSDIKLVADPRNVHLIPADELRIAGKSYSSRVRRDGIGAPVLVQTDAQVRKAREQFLPPGRIYYGMTAILEFQGGQARLIVKDPLASDRVLAAGNNFTLAADFSIGPAAILAKNRPQRLGFIRMIRPAKYADTAMLVRLQPYDPDKIPVLMTHGLQDTAATWAPLLNELRRDPEINKHYQFWVYSYPSGYPFPYSAMLLREELDRVDKTYPHHKKMILVGHSMGGLLSRLLVTDAGMTFWDRYFGKPPDEVPMNAKDKQLLESALIFEHRPDVGRVIFFSTPHRGAGLATTWIGRIGIGLVKLPANLISVGVTATKLLVTPGNSARKPHFPTSIETLSPYNPFVKTLNTLPIADHIPYHSVIGDRGRGNTPSSSDGVVPYWSSHLEGAQSERIVPSGHASHQNQEGMEEADRILRLNLRGEREAAGKPARGHARPTAFVAG
ncbi:MAG: alpha/beta fold hydrolase [Verrucomicrobia bacterium]|nr:alpha/beta fold hydrolase [Verrucomicrobiota bacterium]